MYVSDALGSVRAVYNASASAFSVGTYKPFGKPYTDPPSGTGNIRYAQEMQDPTTGLYYVYARYMDPELGRFVSMDPKGPSLLNPQESNRYAYCVNNPSGYVDPTGERGHSGGGGRSFGHPRKCAALPTGASTPVDSSTPDTPASSPSDEWRVYPIMVIESEVPIPGIEAVQIATGAEFIAILDVYENVCPIRLAGVTIGYEIDAYWYAFLGNPSVEVGSCILNTGFFLGSNPRLEGGLEVNMMYLHLEFDEEGELEGILIEAEIGTGGAGYMTYLGTVRMFVSVFNGVLPLPVFW